MCRALKAWNHAVMKLGLIALICLWWAECMKLSLVCAAGGTEIQLGFWKVIVRWLTAEWWNKQTDEKVNENRNLILLVAAVRARACHTFSPSCSVSLQTEQRLPHGHLRFHVGATSLSLITPSLFLTFTHTLSHSLPFLVLNGFHGDSCGLWKWPRARSTLEQLPISTCTHARPKTPAQSYAQDLFTNSITTLHIFIYSFIIYANNT